MGSGATLASPLNDARTPGRKITLSRMIAGRPMRANRYHRNPIRHSTNWRNKRPTPSLPSVIPVMMNADKDGPTKEARRMVPYNPSGLRYGRRPAPSSESTNGSHAASHVKA